MRSAASDVSTRAASSSTSPAPASIVSRRCFSGESPGPIGAAIPPCAQRVLQSSMLPLVRTSTEPCSRARIAAYSPAMPEPMMR